jgi:hypothetical protein
MKRAVLVLLVLSGCSSMSVERSFRLADKGLAVGAVAVTKAVEVYGEGAFARVESCPGPEATEAERRACLGPFADGASAEEAFDDLRHAYDMMAEALELAQQAYARVQPLVDQAKKELRK